MAQLDGATVVSTARSLLLLLLLLLSQFATAYAPDVCEATTFGTTVGTTNGSSEMSSCFACLRANELVVIYNDSTRVEAQETKNTDPVECRWCADTSLGECKRLGHKLLQALQSRAGS